MTVITPAAPADGAGPVPHTGPPPPDPPDRGVVGALRDALADRLSGAAGRLRLALALVLAGCLLAGGAGASAMGARADALAGIRADATQLVRLQEVRADIVQADAEVTSAYLAGGLEPDHLRETYAEHVREASTGLAELAGRADATGRAALGRASAALARYTGLVETARTHNRLGHTIGFAYLKRATAVLRADLEPELITLGDRAEARVRAAYGASFDAGRLFLVAVAGGILAVAAGQVVLAAHTHRVLSVRAAAGTVIALLGMLAVGLVMASVHRRSDEVGTGPYAVATELARGRAEAFDAKSDESLGLIAQGAGAASGYGEAFQSHSAAARRALAEARDRGDRSTALGLFARWVDLHDTLGRQRAGGGPAGDAQRWAETVRAVTDPAPGGAQRTFEDLVSRSVDELREQKATGDAVLRADEEALDRLRLLLVVAAAVAALLLWAGFNQRLEDLR